MGVEEALGYSIPSRRKVPNSGFKGMGLKKCVLVEGEASVSRLHPYLSFRPTAGGLGLRLLVLETVPMGLGVDLAEPDVKWRPCDVEAIWVRGFGTVGLGLRRRLTVLLVSSFAVC